MTSTTGVGPERRSAGRSPSYPALDLERAIARAGELWARDKQFPTPVASAVRIWGYKGLSGPASMTVAALKKFGLVDDEGSKSDRKVRVTDLAVQILNHPDEEARRSAIREAALKPGIHADMWSQYGLDLPSDENLMWTLTRDLDFTETGAREFLKEYRQTIRFARLTDPGSKHTGDSFNEESSSASFTVQSNDVADVSQEAGVVQARTLHATGQVGAKRYPIRLLNGDDIVVEGRFPLSEEDWHYFYNLLGHMKPAFTLAQATEDT